MGYVEKAIEILGNSLAEHKLVIRNIQNQIKSDKTLSSKAIEDLQADVKKQLIKVDNTVRAHIDSIRVPKDGKDAEVDYEALQEFIVKEVLKVEPEKVDYNIVSQKIDSIASKAQEDTQSYNNKLNAEIQEYIASIKMPKDGENGKDAKVDYTKVNQDIMAQFPKTAIVEDVKKSIPKTQAVVGIKDIKLEKDNLVITTTDGKKRKFPMVSRNFHMFGGGASGYDDTRIIKAINDLKQPVDEKSSDYTVVDTDAILLVDCSSSNVTITLPNASTINKTLNIKRIDSNTLNALSVIPTGGELIDEDSFIELLPFENLTLTSNNTQYYIL